MRQFVSAAVRFSPIALGLLAACDTGTGPKDGLPVAFQLAASAQKIFPSGSLVITSFRLIAGGTALGNGNQFGCQDCNDPGSETSATPEIVTVPLDGTPVSLRTERVQPGTYSMMEVEVVLPTSQILAATPGWTGTNTMVIEGTQSGRPFRLVLPIEGTFREQLATPVVVGASGTPASVTVTLTLPVLSWFTSAAGASLDPTDPAQLALIKANAGKSFGPPEKSGAESTR